MWAEFDRLIVATLRFIVFPVVRITGLEPKYVVSGLLCCVISGYFLSLGLLSLWFPKVSLLWIVTSVATIGAWIWCFGYNYLGIGPKPTMPKLGNFVDDAKGVASLSSQPSSLENKDYVRFVCISDTHNDHKRIKVPDGDVLLHAGDFTKFGTEKEIFEFNRWLGTLPHRHKIVVSGNHDLTMDTGFYDREWRKWHDEKQDSVKAKAFLTNCRYLENEGIEIDGVRVFATPNMPKDSGRLWAWNRSSHHLSEFWEKKLVPQMGKVDVLLTHSPPRGVLDRCWSGHRVGSRPLLAGLRRLKPKFCVFGHIHEDYGVKVEEVSGTVCINAASCTMLGAARHEPIVFDISKSTKAAT